jgi:hypothetical protein
MIGARFEEGLELARRAHALSAGTNPTSGCTPPGRRRGRRPHGRPGHGQRLAGALRDRRRGPGDRAPDLGRQGPGAAALRPAAPGDAARGPCRPGGLGRGRRAPTRGLGQGGRQRPARPRRRPGRGDHQRPVRPPARCWRPLSRPTSGWPAPRANGPHGPASAPSSASGEQLDQANQVATATPRPMAAEVAPIWRARRRSCWRAWSVGTWPWGRRAGRSKL